MKRTVIKTHIYQKPGALSEIGICGEEYNFGFFSAFAIFTRILITMISERGLIFFSV